MDSAFASRAARDGAQRVSTLLDTVESSENGRLCGLDHHMELLLRHSAVEKSLTELLVQVRHGLARSRAVVAVAHDSLGDCLGLLLRSVSDAGINGGGGDGLDGVVGVGHLIFLFCHCESLNYDLICCDLISFQSYCDSVLRDLEGLAVDGDFLDRVCVDHAVTIVLHVVDRDQSVFLWVELEFATSESLENSPPTVHDTELSRCALVKTYSEDSARTLRGIDLGNSLLATDDLLTHRIPSFLRSSRIASAACSGGNASTTRMLYSIF